MFIELAKRVLVMSLIGTCFVFSAFAQQGKIAGQIIDAETGEELIGATVQVVGTSKGAVADINGNYLLSLDPGSYTLKVSYVSYATQKVEGVEILADKNTTLDFSLGTGNELNEIVVTAEAIQDNDVALLKMQKQALSVQDGISNRELNRIGASNAAESVKNVTGASLEGGKYILLRGLGDRYSITQLNGVTLPSTDPYRNSTSLDLIPSNAIENLITVKTFTPDQPGNFTGGKVDVTTRSLPDAFYLNVGLSLGYNTNASLNEQFQFDPNRNSVLTGYDDGTRALPEVVAQNSQALFGGQQLQRQGRSPENVEQRTIINETADALSKTRFVPVQEAAPMNYGLSVAFGNQESLGEQRIGYNIGLTYSRTLDYYENARKGIFDNLGGGAGDLNPEQELSWNYSQDEAQVGALATLSYQMSSNDEITLTNLYNHIGTNSVDYARGFWSSVGSDFDFQNYSILFRERELNNLRLSGKHFLENVNGIKINWSAGYVVSSQVLPDYRQFGFVTSDGNDGSTNYSIPTAEIGRRPTHFFRDLQDEQYNLKLDVEIPLGEDTDNLVKLGGLYSTKQRTFEEQQFSLATENFQGRFNDQYVFFNQANGDFNTYFGSENTGVVQDNEGQVFGFGNYYVNRSAASNSYDGEETVSAAYVMASYRLAPSLKAIGGVRMEITDQLAQSQDTTLAPATVNETDFLPSVNLIYNITDKSNLRVAYSRTLARPNVREISPFSAIASANDPRFTGNPDLQRTITANYDLRYEIYPSPRDLFAVSFYYKEFTDAIVFQLIPGIGGTVTEIKPTNVDRAVVAGGEVEFRKSLDFITPALENFRVAANFSYIFSQVDKGEEELRAINDSGRDIAKTRPFQGQSPYLVNVALFHNWTRLNWENALTLNVFGERISYITNALTPDVYEQPRPILNFTSRKQLGKQFELGFKIKNMLDATYLEEFGRDNNGQFPFRSSTRGTTYSLSVNYSF